MLWAFSSKYFGFAMQINIELFSGRKNPSWIFPEPFSRPVFDLLNDLGALRNRYGSRFPGMLGYRGFNLELRPDVSTRYNLPFRLDIPFDDFDLHKRIFTEILGLVRMIGFGAAQELAKIAELILSLIDRLLRRGAATPAPPAPTPNRPAGPCPFEMLPYDPVPWNDPAYQPTNNCYAYASNKRALYPSKPQPGISSGAMFGNLTGADVAAAARRDGAHDVNDCFPDSEAPRMLVALVIWPGQDYHWYRKHPDCWGHKPGGTAARNVDNAGAIIANPETCDRGPYTEFTGYMLIPKSQRVAA